MRLCSLLLKEPVDKLITPRMIPIMMYLPCYVILLCSLSGNVKIASSNVLETKCEDDFYPCLDGKCIPSKMVNDGHEDCEDGSDEYKYLDEHQDRHWNLIFQKKESLPFSEKGCLDVPKDSVCIFFNDSKFTNITKSSETVKLILTTEQFKVIRRKDFTAFHKLENLTVSFTSLDLIEDEAFCNCDSLVKLILSNNRLETFSSKLFSENNSLQTLDLKHNLLQRLTPEMFERFKRLKKLHLQYNKIETIEPLTFTSCKNLVALNLDNNRITKILAGTFDSLTNLQVLSITNNRINYIESRSFLPLISLNSLGLNSNFLYTLYKGTLAGLRNLSFLDLSDNMIEHIDVEAFADLVKLKSLQLRANSLRELPVGFVSPMKELEFIHFSAFYLCGYATSVSKCLPRGDGISSHKDLLDSKVLRVVIWVIAILACVGNFAVLLGRFVLKEDNRIHSFLIKNLAVADILMGIYLLVIGGHDYSYRGKYIFYDRLWRNSWFCDLSGFISTVSSEASVLTLTVITMDRYICVTYPLTLRKINIKLAYLIMAAIWLFSLALAVIPVAGIKYFGNFFYRDNAVCVPLLLHEPRSRGWEYSAFIFVGINLVSVIFMSYAYVAMFFSIRKSSFRSLHQTQERCLMKRFFFIVLTDCACWVPIIILKILALTGTELPLSVYGWIVVFVLPVNSAVNPLLYTLTTKIFKQKFLVRFTNIVWIGRAYQDNSTSVSIIKSRTSKKEDVEMEQYPLQDESQENTWPGKMRFKYGQGRTVYPSLNVSKDLQIGYTSVAMKG